ncbi:hypothetical protein QBC35DRAFT_484994 [Podospora australis]|uniref:DNA/RNA-binding protein Alba-like domain-containing protein n=1 Tax=Podospora australis TaxID=1536484 RepID=A0AAN7AN90_9PEZI|nr:hypothetical protein QBC35DRAFT_484994 [Podospora australis]
MQPAPQPVSHPPPPVTTVMKRKLPPSEPSTSLDAAISKKRRTIPLQQTQQPQSSQPQKPSSQKPIPPTITPYTKVYSPLLSVLSQNYEVKPMTVLPSTSIAKHVEKALSHLSRFSAWDQQVLPGVVLLCAKSAASSKLITISELIRRRIGETEQKWFQYNVLSDDTVCEETRTGEDEVVEDTFMDLDGDGRKKEGEYFETSVFREKTIHEQAVEGPVKVRYKAHLTILLSRVPLEELKGGGLQTNEHHIELLRRVKQGLA